MITNEVNGMGVLQSSAIIKNFKLFVYGFNANLYLKIVGTFVLIFFFCCNDLFIQWIIKDVE